MNPITFPGLGLTFQIDRVAFTIFGHSIYWYGIIIACGFLLAVAYCCRQSKHYGIKQDDLIDMLFFAVPLCIIGARLYYIIFYFSLYQKEVDGKLVPDFYQMIRIWDGGLAIYGAVIMAILVALVFKKSLFRGEPVPFVLELPNYRMPGVKNVAHLLWEKAKDFLQRAFTIIFLATIVIWFLQSFDLRFNLVSNSQDSILAMLAGGIAPLFAPVGFGDWRISTALITGFMAKESVVSTLTVLFGSSQALLGTLSTAGAAALLVFCLLYTPCAAAIASIRRELGGRWALAVVCGQCVIAWAAAFLTYHIALLL